MKKVLILFLFPCFVLFAAEEDYRSHVEATLREFNEGVAEGKIYRLLNIADQVRENELAQGDMFQVLTGQDSYYLAYQIILEEFYAHERGFRSEDFTFLRGWNSSLPTDATLFLQDHPTLLIDFREAYHDYVINKVQETTSLLFFDFLYEAYNATPSDLDFNPAISSELLSASPGLATAIKKDCAAYVLSSGYGVVTGSNSQEDRVAKVGNQILSVLAQEGYASEKLSQTVMNLVKATPTTEEGLLIQLFFSKETAAQRLYPSLMLGFYDYSYNGDLELFFETYKSKSLDPAFNRKENFQVRVLAGALDPNHVKIKRYSTLNEEQIEAFRAKVRVHFLIEL